ncbi:MAG: N-acetylglucosaminyldiphosphoundecaprenol N-acetyl-beta-D-mannosaminyltransferase [Eubacteriales bacterium]|nr:N-acetylglucosaminyldiphosphoundecaprenol N-acetyl-beta-D-mannosaminyltransferase [Eubacteriales bacterium]
MSRLVIDEIWRIYLLGIWVDLLCVNKLTALIDYLILNDARNVFVGNHNTHSLFHYHKDRVFRRLYDERAAFVHIDGISICVAGKLLGLPVSVQHRVCYLDWLEPLFSLCVQRGYRVFYLGGRPGVAERAANNLKLRFNTLKINTHHGYFNMQGNENNEVVNFINEFRPHILIVGMGMPRQERWIAMNIDRLTCNVILNAGGFFDYIAGETPTPPRYLGPLGLEWAFRALSEPRRLLPRYMRTHTYFALQLMRDICTRKRIGLTTIKVDQVLSRFGCVM